MNAFFARWLPPVKVVEPLPPGIYHYQAPPEAENPYRLHLRIEADQRGVLIVNAATVLHLNSTATEHALQLVQGASLDQAARSIAARYRVGWRKARRDHQELRQRILGLATNPDLDPVLFLGVDSRQSLASELTAPYRLDLALTYCIDPDGHQDPLARQRVARELTTEEWLQVIDRAWEAGIPHLTFTGGEPTRRSDLATLITHAEQHGQVTGVLSEGRRFADPRYLDSLAQAGVDHFLISYLPGDQENAAGIRRAIESDVFTAVHLTLTPAILSSSAEILRDLAAQGVNGVSLSSPDATPEGAAALRQVRHLAAELGLDLIWELPAPYGAFNPVSVEVGEPGTGASGAWLYVEPDGDVLPGQGSSQVLGNILRDPWRAIWEQALALSTAGV